MPTISVIVPVYKVEPYLRRCVDSILGQTFTDFELILVDDGSPDNCPAICDEYAVKDSRVHVIHQENGGLSAARNAGIDASSGEYLMFIDSDDFISKIMLETLYLRIKTTKTKMAVCGIYCIDEHGQDTGESACCPISYEVISANEFLKRLYELHGWFYVPACNKLYHKSLFSGISFPTGMLHEDEFVIADLVFAADIIACVPDKLYYYVRRVNGNITAGSFDKRFSPILLAYSHRYQTLQKIGLSDLLRNTREAAFRMLHRYYFEHDPASRNWKQQFQEGKKIYSNMYGRIINEQLRWTIFQLNPYLYRFIMRFR